MGEDQVKDKTTDKGGVSGGRFFLFLSFLATPDPTPRRVDPEDGAEPQSPTYEPQHLLGGGGVVSGRTSIGSQRNVAKTGGTALPRQGSTPSPSRPLGSPTAHSHLQRGLVLTNPATLLRLRLYLVREVAKPSPNQTDSQRTDRQPAHAHALLPLCPAPKTSRPGQD